MNDGYTFMVLSTRSPIQLCRGKNIRRFNTLMTTNFSKFFHQHVKFEITNHVKMTNKFTQNKMVHKSL